MLAAIEHYFGDEPDDEEVARFTTLMPPERVFAAHGDGRIVGGAGSFPFDLTIPGGSLPCAGVSIVAVLPTDRRRGVLRRMMETQLRAIHAAGEPLAALWASEETIYGRYGYGLASLVLQIDADRARTRIAPGVGPDGGLRFVDAEEAVTTFPRVYEQVRRSTPGHLSRSKVWWVERRLGDRPGQRRGAGPLNRVLLERGGRPVGYCLYRIAQSGSTPSDWKKTVRVIEALGVDQAATRDIWRFLFEIDWTDSVSAFLLPLDHPLLHLADRMNHLHASVWDGLWLRVLDVERALAARAYRPGRATVEVTADDLFPANMGRYAISDGTVRRVRAQPDIAVGVDGLASLYLGGITARDLVRAGRAVERRRGGAARLDAVLGVQSQPWCPEIF